MRRSGVMTILFMTHDKQNISSFSTAEPSRLSNFHWKRKTEDFENCSAGCLECQQNKEGNEKFSLHQQHRSTFLKMCFEFKRFFNTRLNNRDCYVKNYIH